MIYFHFPQVWFFTCVLVCVCMCRCEGSIGFKQRYGLRCSGDRKEGSRGSDLVHRSWAGEITSHTRHYTFLVQFYTHMTLWESTAGVKCLTTFFKGLCTYCKRHKRIHPKLFQTSLNLLVNFYFGSKVRSLRSLFSPSVWRAVQCLTSLRLVLEFTLKAQSSLALLLSEWGKKEAIITKH